jgi:putative ABC transport system ATP-binding protein
MRHDLASRYHVSELLNSGDIAVETVDLTKFYRIGSVNFRALHGVTVKIEKGELGSVLGPSGSDKSRLLNLIGMLDRFDHSWALSRMRSSKPRPNSCPEKRVKEEACLTLTEVTY